jgi:hypothetical protein
MQLGAISILVENLEEALKTYLKLFGSNNVDQVIEMEGLSDFDDIVDSYYLKTRPINICLSRPRSSEGNLGSYLKTFGEGIHHMTLHLSQAEFEEIYDRFEEAGIPVSKIVYLGKFSEAIFWVDEAGRQNLPVKFATKTFRRLRRWKETKFLDTPKRFRSFIPPRRHVRPFIRIKSVMITVGQLGNQIDVWSDMLSTKPVPIGCIFTNEPGEVNDGRGNIFVPYRFQFRNDAGVNIYFAVNEDAPIRKAMAKHGRGAMYHNAAAYVVRDRVHEYWKDLEKSGFAMVDPKPLLNTNKGNGNYFFFVHPMSTHGVLWEFVSLISRDEKGAARYDWTHAETYMVAPDV